VIRGICNANEVAKQGLAARYLDHEMYDKSIGT